MSQMTWIFRRYRHEEGRVGLDGTHVHVLHPDSPAQVLDMAHPTEEAALATFKKVVNEHFSTRHGWQRETTADDIDLATWLPPVAVVKSAAEIETARANAHSRETGWAIDGTTMVISLKRHNVGDLEQTFAHAADITSLHVLISQDDTDGVGRSTLMKLLVNGAAPKATVITFESPWESRKELSPRELSGLTELLAKRPITELAAVGVFPWPKVPPALVRLRLHNPKLTPAELDRIGEMPTLRVLELALPKKFDVRGLASLPLAQLDALVIEYLDDAGGAINVLLDAGKPPATVHLQGDGRPLPALRAAVERWQREAPSSTLSLGNWPMEQLDEETHAVVTAAGIGQYLSPFHPDTRSAELRRLWDPMH